jgi:hypothetical protein
MRRRVRMELLIIVLNKEEYFEGILSIFAELGISGVTVLDGEGFGYLLAYEVPIFAGLQRLLGEKRGANRTILALVEDDVYSEFKSLLAEERIDFTQPGLGVIITLPVEDVIGSQDAIPQ